MKSFNRTYLPDEIRYNNRVYTLNPRISAGMAANNTSLTHIERELSLQGRSAICVSVSNRNLRGKTDLYGNPYKPNRHIYTNV